MPDKRQTFVLVHGAWHGGWCWARVADLLRADGHRVFTPTLTGLADKSHLLSASIDLQTHVDDIVNLMKWEGLDGVCLVGHSYGGVPISLVAEAIGQNIASIVFLDAFVPEDGERPLDLITAHVRADIEAAIARGEVSRAAPPAAYFHVRAPEDVAWVDSLMTPQPNGVWSGRCRLTGARERIARKTYIRAGDYPNPYFDANMERQRLKGDWTIRVIAAGHDAMVDAPEELARMLVDAA